MNIAIIDAHNNGKKSIIDAHNNGKKSIIDAHKRNSFVLANELNCDCIFFREDYKEKIYDILIFSYGTFYADINLYKKILKDSADAKIIWITNEYNLSPNSIILKGKNKIDVIGNFEINDNKYIDKYYFLNLNLLLARKANIIKSKKYDCIYYGTYRIDREKYFKQYINNIYLSTSTKNFKKYKHIGCNPIFINKLNWKTGYETLNSFRYSLYIEDEYTHTNFNNLANRWYEAGFCNCVIFFDVNCWNTIRKSEISKYEDEIKYYIISNHNELIYKINECNADFEKHLNIQKSWRKDELLLRQQMINEFKNIIYNSPHVPHVS